MTTYKLIDTENEVLEITTERKQKITKTQLVKRKEQLESAIAEVNNMLSKFNA